uniref:Uncharacterized protein n=1 Tax=Eutreptiella gymnastica TaxID=73025 RepID=A0A7S4LBB5_9EUGL|mmetsp:Transcript_34952/g.58545  ORF Transcript_34952/g.58545 Transcript_34952/m.58545 type:complete len:105 (+) Transcript_34952:29-343(+)
MRVTAEPWDVVYSNGGHETIPPTKRGPSCLTKAVLARSQEVGRVGAPSCITTTSFVAIMQEYNTQTICGGIANNQDIGLKLTAYAISTEVKGLRGRAGDTCKHL